tara:strand:- start:1664 stop:1924 length:261 start_codon:yes stop_codon:yes gene_type:complete
MLSELAAVIGGDGVNQASVVLQSFNGRPPDSKQISEELAAMNIVPLDESINALKRHPQSVAFAERSGNLLWTPGSDRPTRAASYDQ